MEKIASSAEVSSEVLYKEAKQLLKQLASEDTRDIQSLKGVLFQFILSRSTPNADMSLMQAENL